MADIEERAEKYAAEYAPTRFNGKPLTPGERSPAIQMIKDAYLAGSAQTQQDYAAHYEGSPRA